MLSSKSVFEKLVLRSLRALPLMKPVTTPGGGGGGGGGGAWQEEKCVYGKVSVSTKKAAKIDRFVCLFCK